MVDDLIYDVGMNSGDDTAFYLSKGFRVVAVEADPTLADQARVRFADALCTGRLHLVNAAIAPEEGVADFWICHEKREWNSFDRAFASRNGLLHHSIPVQCRRFRDLLQQYGTPLYLKIDIEGHDHYCLDDLNHRDLPRYVSLEMGPFETLFKLGHLGYTDFKLITQNDHSQLSIDLLSTRAMLKRRLRPYPALYRLGQRASALLASATRRTPPVPDANGNGWHFAFGSSGPFGEETAGAWQTLDQTAFTWAAYQLGHSQYGPPVLGVWHDVHARRRDADEADPSLPMEAPGQ